MGKPNSQIKTLGITSMFLTIMKKFILNLFRKSRKLYATSEQIRGSHAHGKKDSWVAGRYR
jgi:hypothetical protein